MRWANAAIPSLIVSLLIPAAARSADGDAVKTITVMYSTTLSALHVVKTRDELLRIVNAIDAPEWVSNLPSGETLTRAEAVSSLEPLLAVPPENRPVVKQHFVYLRETGWNVLVLYWVYRQSEHQLVGSLVRDTWVRTAESWRRIRHEKFFPDRPLSEDGRPLILPPDFKGN
ncbi:exported hypothetical protein [Candidatus Sulfopaludibacter sp. SbA3]|nr:exported hypothetical protein [Candidatus Sulfopaludibacter sp. SbA3]